jgi:hypothetical protein
MYLHLGFSSLRVEVFDNPNSSSESPSGVHNVLRPLN